jgi:RHS repeat-associated protein
VCGSRLKQNRAEFAKPTANVPTAIATAGADCWGQSFGIDRYGNLNTITVTKCSALSLSLSFNNSNQITNTNFTYDSAGNMTHDGSNAYTWDAENKLKTAVGVTYTYDGDGWRRKSSNGKLFWNDSGCSNPVLMETDLSGNNAQEFIYLEQRRIARRESSGAVYYYFDDHLGSGRVMTNATGVTQQESAYYPYGGEIVVTNTVDNRYKFTGKRRDTETLFDYSLYRMYYPNEGRWMTTDPVRGKPGDPQSENLYPYVRNNPLNLTDPLGDRFSGLACQPAGGAWIPWLDPLVLVDGFDFSSNSGPWGGSGLALEPMCVDGAWEGGDFVPSPSRPCSSVFINAFPIEGKCPMTGTAKSHLHTFHAEGIRVRFVRAEGKMGKGVTTIGNPRSIDPFQNYSWAQDFFTNLGGTLTWFYSFECVGKDTVTVTRDQEIKCPFAPR